MNKKSRRKIAIILIVIICIFSIFFTPKKNTITHVDSSRDVVFECDRNLEFSPIWKQASSVDEFLQLKTTYDFRITIDNTHVDLPTYFAVVTPLLIVAAYFMITSMEETKVEKEE